MNKVYCSIIAKQSFPCEGREVSQMSMFEDTGRGDKKLLIMVTWGAGGVSQKFIGFALKARYALRFQTKCLYF